MVVGKLADRSARHQMREVGTEAAVGRSAADRVAIDACSGLENDAPVRRGRVENRWILLGACPALEIWARFDDSPEQHHRVLGAAVLAALSEIGSGDLRIYPHRVFLIR